LAQIGGGVLEVALGMPSQSAADKDVGRSRIEPDRLVVIGDGARQVGFGVPGEPAMIVGECVAGVEANSGGEVLGGAVELALARERSPAAAIGVGGLRLALDRRG